MVAGRGSDQPEERPEWLPVGWTICTKTRNKGKLDRYYMSPSGQTMRTKAEVLRCKNKNMTTSIKHEFESQSACRIDAKRQSEHENLEVSHAIKEDTPISLPDGWIVETKTRKGGKSSGANYKIYINPATGYKCYSMKEVNRYLTGGEISAPISKSKTKATLKSPDSVLTENEGSSMEQPPCPKKASKTKKNQIPTVAATHNQSPVRRSSSRSSMSKPSGNDSPKVTPKIHKASDKVRAGKIKDAFEEQPHSQDVFPEHSLEEAVDDISESIDKIIRNLSLDLKIPDISISFSLDQAEFDLVNKTEACNDSGVGCSENTREKKVKNNSVPPLPRKSRKRFDPHSAAANEDILNANGAVEVVNETSADMVPSETNEMSDGNNPPLAIDKSDGEKRSSKRKASRGKQSEADDVDPSPVIKKDAKFENNARKQEETVTKSTRIKGHQKDETPTSSSRVSRRLAGLHAGNADINENDLRRNKRLRI